MKKLSSVRQIGLLLLTVLSISCQDPTVIDISVEDQDEIVLYNSIRVLKPAGFPIQVLQLKSSAEASDFLSAKYQVPFNSKAQARTAIPDETFYGILATSTAKFVDIDKPIYDQISEDQMHRYFPDFKSKKDLKDHSDVVLDYFSRLIMNDFKKSLQKVKGARYPTGGGNAYE